MAEVSVLIAERSAWRICRRPADNSTTDSLITTPRGPSRIKPKPLWNTYALVFSYQKFQFDIIDIIKQTPSQ